MRFMKKLLRYDSVDHQTQLILIWVFDLLWDKYKSHIRAGQAWRCSLLKTLIHDTYPDHEARDRQAVCSDGLPQRGQNSQDFPLHEFNSLLLNWEFSCLYGLPQRSENFQDFPFCEFSLLLCWTSRKRMMLSRTFIPWKLLFWNLLQQGQAPLPRCQDAKTLCSVTGTFQHLQFSFLECKLLS